MTREERQKAINALKISAPVIAVTQEEFNDYIQTLNQVMDWLEQEPCEDAISRQAVLETLDNMDNVLDEDRTIKSYKELLKECYEVLPPVKQKPKTGWWKKIATYPLYECSKCKLESMLNTWDYCPNCGCRMVEPQESEDKE